MSNCNTPTVAADTERATIRTEHTLTRTIPVRDERFYVPDGNAIFEVEGVLFNIHRSFFQRDSAVFSTMFSLPQTFNNSNYHIEGCSDDHPICLEGTSSLDFTRAPDPIGGITLHSVAGKCELRTAEEWISVLRLTTKWEFDGLRARAVDKLRRIATPVEKIMVSREVTTPELQREGYEELCARREPLRRDEGVLLGLSTVLEIIARREHRLRTLPQHS